MEVASPLHNNGNHSNQRHAVQLQEGPADLGHTDGHFLQPLALQFTEVAQWVVAVGLGEQLVSVAPLRPGT